MASLFRRQCGQCGSPHLDWVEGRNAGVAGSSVAVIASELAEMGMNLELFEFWICQKCNAAGALSRMQWSL